MISIFRKEIQNMIQILMILKFLQTIIQIPHQGTVREINIKVRNKEKEHQII